MKAYREKNREAVQNQVAEWQGKNRQRTRDLANTYYHEVVKKHPDLLRAKRRLAKYGLSADTFSEMLVRCGSLCEICSLPITEATLHVDHDHRTGKVRGLLCQDCNLGVGRFKDSPQALEAAADYLRNRGS